MKKAILLIVLFFSFAPLTESFSASKPKIPVEVKEYINVHYPNAKSIHWQRNDQVFIAHFVSNNVETVVYLNDKGEFMNKLTEITSFGELPQDIKTKVDPRKMLSGEKLEGNEGEIFYIFEVTRPKGKIEELVFDAEGKEIRNLEEGSVESITETQSEKTTE